MNIYFKSDTPKPIKKQFYSSLKKIGKFFKATVIQNSFIQIIARVPYQNPQTSVQAQQDLMSQQDKLLQQFKFNFYDKFIKYVSKWQLIGYSQKFDTFLYKISHIQFVSLKCLYLCKCKITNIQPLTWLQAPLLGRIDLSQCLLLSLKPLHKFKFNRFSQLNIVDNQFLSIQQFKYFSRLKIEQRKSLQYSSQIDFCTPIYNLVYNKQVRQQNRARNFNKGTSILIYFQLMKLQRLDISIQDLNNPRAIQIDSNIPFKIRDFLKQRFNKEIELF